MHEFFMAIGLLSSMLLTDGEATDGHLQNLPEFSVLERHVANFEPAGTYPQLVSNLRFEPKIDLQSRNFAEAQGDVSIRGGIFESASFKVGASSLFDPQTGHYSAEIPISPAMTSEPRVSVGLENSLAGFNSTVGTLRYDLKPISVGFHGAFNIGVSEGGLNRQGLYGAIASNPGNSKRTFGLDFDVARSESNGVLPYGDHDFNRYVGRMQIQTQNTQTDFLAGYQSKNFGWPNMYTPFGRNEREELQTRLLLLNHRRNYGTGDFVEVAGYYRRNKDHYTFDRFQPETFEAFHETTVWSVSFEGRHTLSDSPFSVNYNGQFVADKIDSTALVFGDFRSRSYIKIGVIPEWRFNLAPDRELIVKSGAIFDHTNRDGSAGSPLFGLEVISRRDNRSQERFYIEYSESSQVAGYTAIASNPNGGLFRGNQNLSRENSTNLEAGFEFKRERWSGHLAVWYRLESDLLDWTFSFEDAFARTANNVDINNLGFELIYARRWSKLDLILGYTFLRKTEDYDSAAVDASFYALNFPRHRLTLAAVWRPLTNWEIRSDNEIRLQEPSTLRRSSNKAVISYLSLSWKAPFFQGIELIGAVDNLFDSEYEEIPAVPASPRQVSFSAIYHW